MLPRSTAKALVGADDVLPCLHVVAVNTIDASLEFGDILQGFMDIELVVGNGGIVAKRFSCITYVRSISRSSFVQAEEEQFGGSRREA